MKALSLKAGLGETFVRDVIKRGAIPTIDKIQKLAEALDVPMDVLLENVGANMSVNTENGTNNIPPRTVPQIDVTAGMGGGGLTSHVNVTHNGITITADQVSGVWGLPDSIYARIGVPPSRLAALPVQGDSMHPTLNDGDVIFVDTGHRAPSPDGIYALADDFGGVIVKRLESHGGDGVVRIISDNDRHAAYERNVDDMFIFGRFVARWTS